MPFQCNACSFKGKQFAGGECPACGSFDIRTLGKKPAEPVVKMRSPFRLAFLTAVWLLWAVLVYRQYLGS